MMRIFPKSLTRTAMPLLLGFGMAAVMAPSAYAQDAVNTDETYWTTEDGSTPWVNSDGECWHSPEMEGDAAGPEDCVEAQAAPDSDGDGVPDDQDACPNTPEGVEVDAQGCPLDDDNDGVPNYLDQCPRTPEGARVDEQGCQIVIEETVNISLDVNFAFDSAEVQQQYYPAIEEVAQFMTQHPSTDTVIEGHTDSTGPEDYNKELSQERAQAVVDVLVNEFGIDENRLTPVGYGEEQPVADNDTKQGRAENRRVVATITATEERRLRE